MRFLISTAILICSFVVGLMVIDNVSADSKSDANAAGKQPAGVESVLSPEGAWKMIADGALVVDVRTKAEYDSGHLASAINIPHDTILQHLDQFGDKANAIILYCRSGQRSGAALESLRSAGYTNVWNAGGYEKLNAATPHS